MSLAILVVSDTCSVDHQKDKAAKPIAEAFPQFPNPSISYVADDFDLIKQSVTRLAKKANLLITTGGTGFSPRDVTPEAVSSVLDKHAPGLVTAMLMASLKITPLAAVSRPTAGVIGHCLVITVPGSPKAAIECLEPLKPVLSHALELLAGKDSRALHESSSSSLHTTDTNGNTEPIKLFDSNESIPHSHVHGHSHSHGNLQHNRSHSGPTFYGVSARPRESPYEMINFEKALDMVLEATPPSKAITVSLDDSLGHVLAEDLFSPLNVPPFRASIVDGYAVTHSDCPGTLPVSKVLVASSDLAIFTRSTCVRITTGAPVPHGATAVVPVENTVVAEEVNGEEVTITINADNVQSGDNIRKIGSDLALGTLVLPKGTFISPIGGEVGTLASTGLFCVPVFAKPTVGVLSTGNELVNVNGTCYGSQIWDSNRPMLLTSLRYRHIPSIDLGIVRDSREELKQALTDALEKVDILVTTGGVSMGELDLLKPTIEELGGKIHFGRVAMKPGKPMTFATIGTKCIFALPGNPASAAVCLNLFVFPSIYKWMGADPSATKIKVHTDTDLDLDPRPEFHRVHISTTDDGWVASSTGFQRSSRVKSLAGANAVLCLPPRTDELKILKAGSVVEAILLSPP